MLIDGQNESDQYVIDVKNNIHTLNGLFTKFLVLLRLPLIKNVAGIYIIDKLP